MSLTTPSYTSPAVSAVRNISFPDELARAIAAALVLLLRNAEERQPRPVLLREMREARERLQKLTGTPVEDRRT